MCNGHAGVCAPLPQESVAPGKVRLLFTTHSPRKTQQLPLILNSVIPMNSVFGPPITVLLIIIIMQVYSGCVCVHNTDGVQCDECEVGFNSLPWREGNETDANVCEGKFDDITELMLHHQQQ